MIGGLERFVAELRQAGLAVSPAEWIEALRAAEIVGVDRRERFRAALRCSLAKRARHQALFDEVFERFFAAPGRGAGRRGRSAGRGTGQRRSTRSAVSGEPQLRQRIEQARDGAPRSFGRLRHVVVAASAEDGPLARDRSGGQPQRRELHRRLAPDEEREIAAQVPRIVDRLRLRTSRRARLSSRGRVYLRRAFRDNLRHDGVPFVLPRRRRPRKRSRVVLLIDVSWSTARAAGLFLAVADEFLRRARDRRVLFFVDRAVDATDEVERWLREADPLAFARCVGALRGLNLQAPSDYGRALHMLLRSRHRPRGRDTLLLVLGDGRTNRFDPQDWAFEEIAEACGAVLWIVPEPVARWGTGDSALGAYLRHVDVAVEARDLAGLARGVAELVRRL